MSKPANPFSVVNPVTKGESITLPAGTVVHSTNPSKPSYVLRRAQTVKVAMVTDGWIDTLHTSREGRGFVQLPQVTWVGTGHYWCDAQVTPALVEANGKVLPDLPGQDGVIDGHYRLDVAPSYEKGYCNLWEAPRD